MGEFRVRIEAAITLLALVAALLAGPAAAQGRFAPVIGVDDAVITRHELDQRTLFLTLLRAPGDPRDLAREQLINERLQLRAATRAGIEPSPEAVAAGIEEFAGRAELTGEEFLAALGQAGVEPETFRDFITAGVAWRDYVRASFGDEARDIPREQVRRTLGRTGTEGGVRVLLSEVVLPAASPQDAAASRVRAEQVAALRGQDAFAAAARRYSIAPTAANGGALDWRAVEGLPPEVAAVVAGLPEGGVSRPVTLGEVIAVYLLRDREVVAGGPPASLSIEYALFTVAGGRAEAEAVRRRVDTCDDLYGVAKGLPPERLVRETVPAAALPADIRAAIGTLDVGEATTAVARGGNATVLMLCQRTAGLESTVDLEIVGTRLLNQRLQAIAVHHLAELRARANIVDLAG